MCPACRSTDTAVIESRITAAGKRRRRHECNTCQHRWTTWERNAAPARPPKPRKPRTTPKPQLTPRQIGVILQNRRPHAEMARELGRSKETIRQVRFGVIHVAVHPEIPRWNQPDAPIISGASCHKCEHWADRCTFGYPDPLEEGPGFASDCAMYSP